MVLDIMNNKKTRLLSLKNGLSHGLTTLEAVDWLTLGPEISRLTVKFGDWCEVHALTEANKHLLREKVWSINQFPTYWWLELSRFVKKWERELFSQYISANEMAFFRWGKCLESFNLKDNMSPHEQLKYQIDFLIQMWLYLSLWLFNRDKFLRNLKHRENLQDFTFVAGLSLIFTQHIINLLTFQCRIIK